MNQNENAILEARTKTLSAAALRELLKNPTQEIMEGSGRESSILIEGYTVTDEHIILDESVSIHRDLRFKNCNLNSDNFVWIGGLVCEGYVTFDGCSFSKGIYFNKGEFTKELSFDHVHLPEFHFSGGTFDKISIAGYDIKSIWISGAKFESLSIGERLVNTTIDELTIFAKPKEVGDIFVTQQKINKLYLSGNNKDRMFSFAQIKCNIVALTDFTNEGSLRFYGIEPQDLANEKRYFQIINSNCDKVQFHRVLFNHYEELIIIDSFISDALFIGCKWGDTIRALYGPGYETFEESLKTGRKYTPKELVDIKEAYRQLKISMSNHSDKIQEHKFYSKELTFHYKALTWGKPWENQFWDKLILLWSKVFSDYGQSFIKPLF